MADFNSNITRIKWIYIYIYIYIFYRARSAVSPHSHALEHLGVGVEGEHGGTSHAWAVQKAEGQALHEGQRRGLGCAVVYSARYGWERQDGVDADDVARLQLQHTRQERFCSLGDEKNNKHTMWKVIVSNLLQVFGTQTGKESYEECRNRKWGFPFLKHTRMCNSLILR